MTTSVKLHNYIKQIVNLMELNGFKENLVKFLSNVNYGDYKLLNVSIYEHDPNRKNSLEVKEEQYSSLPGTVIETIKYIKTLLEGFQLVFGVKDDIVLRVFRYGKHYIFTVNILTVSKCYQIAIEPCEVDNKLNQGKVKINKVVLLNTIFKPNHLFTLAKNSMQNLDFVNDDEIYIMVSKTKECIKAHSLDGVYKEFSHSTMVYSMNHIRKPLLRCLPNDKVIIPGVSKMYRIMSLNQTEEGTTRNNAITLATIPEGKLLNRHQSTYVIVLKE